MSPDGESRARLAMIACPWCGKVGSITLGSVLVAKPMGTWSLAGVQPKTTAVETPALRCPCGWYKLPSTRSGKEVPVEATEAVIHPSDNPSEAEHWRAGAVLARRLAAVIPAGSTVIDYGCGDGRVALPLHELGYKVIGVDTSPAMIAALARNAPEVPGLLCGGSGLAARLTAPADAVVCLAVLTHHDAATCAEIIGCLRAVVRVGGLLILDWPLSDTPEVATWSREAQEDVIVPLGLQRVDLGLPWGTFRVLSPRAD